MVGTSLSKHLSKTHFAEVISATRSQVDLLNFDATHDFIDSVNPDYIINCAARVGGIYANNTHRTEFLIENLKINLNILESVVKNSDIKIINLGSSCIYPLNASNPIKEESIMSGKLETTNSPYAMAKLTAIEMGDAMSKQYGHKILNLMPTNLYGPNDHFNSHDSHVIPGLIYRMEKAKINKEATFTIWGTGKPKREFLFVDDLSKAIVHLIDNGIDTGLYNIGSGIEVSILDLVNSLRKIIEYEGELVFDESFPDGNPRKLIDSTKIISTGWKPEVDLNNGLQLTYDWFLENVNL